ncbi:MAG: hypothetical protein JNL42_03030 [Anaerolineae bacterium]|nr:hypothetical protein [Anaerolineae bacterium]
MLESMMARWKDRTAADYGIILAVVACLAIVALGVVLTRFELEQPGPAFDGFFYEWQRADPDFWSRATAWVGFGLHQIGVWLCIYYAQKHYTKYTDRLRGANWAALGVNTLFIVLHFFQTMFFYDGIAQDLPSWTAQFTVIMMLFVIVAMENKRRGIFFGRKVNFRQEFYAWMRQYHGYAFSFAVIYTFWFHPMVFTLGHLGGFVHVILVMVQGSIFFTKMHLNRNWKFLLEVLVLPHAALVALNQGGGLVYMFLFGFLAMFIVTQMHGLGYKRWLKWVYGLAFAGAVAITYLILRQPYQVNEVIRIPAILYLMVFVMYGLWWLWAKFTGRLSGDRRSTTDAAPLEGAAA